MIISDVLRPFTKKKNPTYFSMILVGEHEKNLYFLKNFDCFIDQNLTIENKVTSTILIDGKVQHLIYA